MLQVEHLYKSFDTFKAVNGAELTVNAGEMVAVIGPNGAGKTTLFNLISGQLKADHGRILFKGEPITGLPAYEICRRGIARSFQIANIFPRLTVFRNVQVSILARKGLGYRLFTPAQRLVVEETHHILESVGLIDKKLYVAGALSHGDKRTLEIAIALGNEPQLLVLDEPTAGMSPEETESAMALVKRLARDQGLTILFCEHDMDVVFNVANRIMVMQNGRTIAQGTPAAVRANSAVQQAYLGEVE